MEVVKYGVQISVIYTDEHLLELRVWASNGLFVGQTEVYADSAELSAVASVLRGFPANRSDTRECEFGTFDAQYGGGGAGFRFCCTDSVGHALVEVRLRTDPRLGVGASDTANIHIPVESAAVDSFVGQLERMLPEPGQSALLEAAG